MYTVRILSADGGNSSPLSKRGSSRLSEAAMLELENLKARCKQLATELDKARKTMHTEREEFHLKETKLEASLTASRKANLELEVRKDSQDNYNYSYSVWLYTCCLCEWPHCSTCSL